MSRLTTRRPTQVVLALSSVCLLMAIATSAGAECVNLSYEMNVPDAKTLKLNDGEHKLAEVDTKFGKLEARVKVRDAVASPARYYLGGKPLKPIKDPHKELPAEAQRCLQSAAVSWQRLVVGAARWLADTLVPPAHAAVYTFKVVYTYCTKGECAYVLECNSGGRFCGYYVV